MEPNVATAEPLIKRIKKAVDSGSVSLPPLPDIVLRLVELLKDRDTASSKRIAALVRNEPAVTATLLRWANSAAFGGLHRISDLTQAIARLGTAQVSSAVTTVAHSGHFRSEDPEKMELLGALWGHAVATAIASRKLAAQVGSELEEAYIAGLLHDAGKLLILKAIDYLDRKANPLGITTPVLDEIMDVLHAKLGHKMLASWRLPDPVCEAALRHHDEEVDLETPVVLCVQVADAVARKMGEHPRPEPDLNLLELKSVDQLNLTDLEVASLIVDVEDEIAEVRTLLH
jgi:putative nucleotidyltransferase with HDIG domain